MNAESDKTITGTLDPLATYSELPSSVVREDSLEADIRHYQDLVGIRNSSQATRYLRKNVNPRCRTWEHGELRIVGVQHGASIEILGTGPTYRDALMAARTAGKLIWAP